MPFPVTFGNQNADSCVLRTKSLPDRNTDLGRPIETMDNDTPRTSRVDDVLLRQIQTTPNRRMLKGMKTFRLESDTPTEMVDLLRRMEAAEARAMKRRA